MHEITKKCNDKSSVVEEIKVGDRSITDPDLIAENFNSFFSTIGATIAEQIAPSNKVAEDYLVGEPPNEFTLNSTDPLEIINTTKKLKSKYSSDTNGLSSAFTKK